MLKPLLSLFVLAASFPAHAQTTQTTQTAAIDTLVIHFASNEFRLDPDACATIARYFVSNAASAQPPRVSSISGHCDNTGADRFNENLSLLRATAVSAYLMDKWPEQSDHVIIRGLGSRQPVAGNGTEEGRARNRRVVILIKRQEGRTVADLLTDTATRAGDSLILKDVNFYPGRHTPLPTSLPVLDQLATAMNANPRLSIGIDGYVCCTDAMGDGLDLDNGQQDLSAQRAKYVYDYLIGRGIAPERLRYTGHGGQNKLYPAEVNEAQQSANRRVVIRILEK